MTLTPAGAPDWGSGTERPVVRAPDPILGCGGDRVDPCAGDVTRLVADLVATMRAAPGCVGLAAVQVGVPLPVFVVDVTGHPKTNTCHGLLALCNASISSASRWRMGREGCTSVPDLTGDVRRAGRLVVTGEVAGTGEVIEIESDAFEARALQHEIDHCAGLLFLDRVAGAHAVHARQVYL